MNKRNELKIGIGASSILMIILTLVLTAFGVLSLVSARADQKLTEKTKNMMADYYAADEKVEELLASIDAVLIKRENTETQNLELSKIDDALVVEKNGSLFFSVRVNENRQIAVRLQILSEEDHRYDVITRRLESTGKWDPETDIETWTN